VILVGDCLDILPTLEAESVQTCVTSPPYFGLRDYAGTTAVVCERLARRWVGCELNPEYAAIADRRIRAVQPGLALGASTCP
jgi:DNA modification methylase